MSEHNHPRVGQKAPDFRLPATGGAEIGLGDFKGKQDVILYFYPKDDTSGCTKEACAFRDDSEEYKRRGVAVLGVSPDDVESHDRFTSKFQLNFPLLADPEKKTINDYGIWGERIRNGEKSMGILRTTFLIDKQGVIRKVYPQVNPEGHSNEILRDIDALRAGA